MNVIRNMDLKMCLFSYINEIYNDDEDEDVLVMEMYRQFFHVQNAKKKKRLLLLKHRYQHIRPGLYSEMWINLYTENDFFMTFRMKRVTFQQLLNLLMRQKEIQKTYVGGNEPVQSEKVQQIALYYLAHQISMVQIGDKFDVATSTVMNCITIWINCFLQLVPILIQWPTINQRITIEERFKNIAGFPGVIGAIDGCHINVMAPSSQQKCYQNRYMTHSIILQGICTSDYLFTNVHVGYPGSANDCRVLANSRLYINIEANGYSEHFLPNQHLLGDKIYPIKEWLLPPFKDYGNMTRRQIIYNKIHSKTRVKIENSFGLLKGRWRRLKYIIVYKIAKASNIVMACCALHNFCLLNNDFAEALLDIDIERIDGVQFYRRDDNRNIVIDKRNNILMQLSEK